MAYAISLLDDDTGDTLSLHHTVTEERIRVVTAWSPAGPDSEGENVAALLYRGNAGRAGADA